MNYEIFLKDVRYALRNLRRAPTFTLAVVFTMALGIGANTAIFSVVDAVLLDPLPFPEADRLVAIQGAAPGSELQGEIGVSDELYVQYRENTHKLEDLGMYALQQSTARADTQVDRLFMLRATPSFFSTLGVRPVLGRLPTPDDGERVVVISHWLWTTWFHSDSAVLDRSYEFSGAMRTVIGVMGPEFRFPDERVALWIPWQINAAEVRPGGWGLNLVGRMAPGTNHAEVVAELAPLATRLSERFGGPAEYVRVVEKYRPVVRSVQEQLVGGLALPLQILLGTTAIVLLVACANVANLFMVRAESRRHDLVVRRALGAGRAGLIRSQMVEALLLALAGGGGGLLIAWAAVPLLVRAAPEGIASGWSSGPIPRLAAVDIDLTALLFTVGVSVLAAALFGLAPAIRFSRPELLGGLRQAARGIVGRRRFGRDALVVAQIASAFVLLVASGLLVRSFLELTRVDPGFDTENIFTFQIAPQRDDVNDGPSFARFHYGFMERLAAMPGVESVGVVNTLPLDEGAPDSRFQTDRTGIGGTEEPILHFTFIGGDYLETMGIRLLSGQSFDLSDHLTGKTSTIVSRSTAEILWPGEEPLGKRLRPSFISATMPATWWTVVGVVEDVLLNDLRRGKPDPMVYMPMSGPTPRLWAVGSPAYVVKSIRADVMAADIRELVREVVPESPMYRVFTMKELAANSMANLSFTMVMIAIAAGLAVILGAVGIYGVLSSVVSQRTREIAIRMALGADVPAVRRMVVFQGGVVALAGIALGILAAVGVTRVLETLLFGVRAVDAPTFVIMSSVMLAIAMLASYLPARRASRVDPVAGLRAE